MPADELLASASTAGESSAEVTTSPESRGCILVVDDNTDNVEVLRVRLDSWGYETHAATNGAEALEYVQQSPPDLILLDVMMPGVDGWEMLRRVQERHGTGAIPVVMFSGKVDEETLAEATARGARGFVGKPFDLQQLIDQTKQIVPV